MKMRGLAIVVIACITMLSPLGSSASAAPGDLDRAFGNRGVVDLADELAVGPGYLSGVELALGPGDEIFVLSRKQGVCGDHPTCTPLRISKYGPDGAPDTSYRAGFERDADWDIRSVRMAVDSSGRVVVAMSDDHQLTVLRFAPNGAPDLTFGIGGRAVLELGGPVSVQRLAIGSADRIVVAGALSRAPGGTDLLVVRLQSNGLLDPGFGGSGLGVVDLMPRDEVGGLALVGDELLLGAFEGRQSRDRGRLRVTRFSVDGRLLEVFGAWSGKHSVGPFLGVSAVLAKPRGGVQVVSGVKDGTILSNFFWDRGPDLGSGRRQLLVVRGFSTLGSFGAASDPRGRAILGGTIPSVDRVENEIDRPAVLRLNPEGGVDRTFGGGRPLVLRLSSDSGRIRGVAVQSRGRIVVLGQWFYGCIRVCPSRPARLSLVRLIGGPSGARCHGRKATVVGTRQPEAISGTRRRDVIQAFGGADKVFGRGGNDLICGGPGDDRLFGQRGNDRLVGGRGRDRRRQ